MKRYMSGTEVEKVLAAVGVAANEEKLCLTEGELEGRRMWRSRRYPDPSVVIGGEPREEAAKDRPRFGWELSDLLRWLDAREYMNTRERHQVVSRTLWELGYEKEAHGLVIGPTGAPKG